MAVPMPHCLTLLFHTCMPPPRPSSERTLEVVARVAALGRAIVSVSIAPLERLCAVAPALQQTVADNLFGLDE